MPEISRRVFLRRIGSSTIAVVTLGLVACSSDVSGEPSTTVPASTTTAALITPASAGTAATTGQTTVPPSTRLEVERLSLGNVAAFIVARDAAAAVIDTGNPGSAGSVEVGLTALGLDWDAVGDVILTHRHGDHVGSLTDILTRAPGALGYAGALDLDRISSPSLLVGVGDGDTVFGLQIVETPGHTPGHIAVWDSIGGALFAGDALTGGAPGELAGPNPGFTSDMASAIESVQKMAALDVSAIYVGHGEPIVADAADQLSALAASL